MEEKSCDTCFNRDPWADKNCHLKEPMKCLFPEGGGFLLPGTYAYADWKPLNPNKVMNDAGISCKTCMSSGDHPHTSCNLNARECLGDDIPLKYNLWVEREKKKVYHKQDDSFYNDSFGIPEKYFDAGGEAIRDAIDADILKEVAEDAEAKDSPTIFTLCNLVGAFCVTWTVITLGSMMMVGVFSFLFWLVG